MAEPIFRRLKEKDYAALKTELARLDAAALSEIWPGIAAFEKVVAFKLLPVPRALELYRRLPPAEKIFLLSIRPAGALGPVIDGMPPEEIRKLFHQLSEGDEAAMLADFGMLCG